MSLAALLSKTRSDMNNHRALTLLPMEMFLWLPGTKFTGGSCCREKEGQGLFPNQEEIFSISFPH